MDTRNKRASALGFALAFRLVLPAPDALVDTADRPHVAYSYAGISLLPPPHQPAVVCFHDVAGLSPSLSDITHVSPALEDITHVSPSLAVTHQEC